MGKTYLERWIKAGGVKTHYLTSGNGEPVILLHGGGAGVSAVHNWQDSMGPLAEAGFSVYAPEVVGFGLTDKPEEGDTVDAKVQHVKDFIDSLCLERFRLVGNSMGGVISLRIGADWAERVESIVLMGSPGVRFVPPPELRQLFAYTPSREKMKAMVETFCYDPSVVNDEMIELRYQMSLLPGAQESYERLMRGMSNTQGGAMNMEAQLPEINTPTLLIWGKQDKIVPLELGETMVKLLPNARLEVIDKCGHWVQIEHSQTFNKMVIDFFIGRAAAA
jgi:pimeloyl-ACP methyl ester carboxylesterase